MCILIVAPILRCSLPGVPCMRTIRCRCHGGFHQFTPGRQQLPTPRGQDRRPTAATVLDSFDSAVPFPGDEFEGDGIDALESDAFDHDNGGFPDTAAENGDKTPLAPSEAARGSGDSPIEKFKPQSAPEQILGLFDDDDGSGSDVAVLPPYFLRRPPSAAAAADDVDLLEMMWNPHPARQLEPVQNALVVRRDSQLHRFVSKVAPDQDDILYATDNNKNDEKPLRIPSGEALRRWWPLEESLVSRGSGDSPIYTFESQFAPEQEFGLFDDGGSGSDGALPTPSPGAAADIDFLRSLDMDGMKIHNGWTDAPIRRLMISPALTAAGEAGEASQGKLHPPYDMNNPPTPATLAADLKVTDFRSAITNLDDDGAGGPLPFLGYRFDNSDAVHEDEENQWIFCTAEEFAESMAEEPSTVFDHEMEKNRRSRALLRALKKYALGERVFFMTLHTDRWDPRQIQWCFPEGISVDTLLLGVGVSVATGNLVGVMTIDYINY